MNRIEIDEQLCKGCGYCVQYCPQKIIELGNRFNDLGYKYAAPRDWEGICTACKTCALMCPDAAIRVYREMEE